MTTEELLELFAADTACARFRPPPSVRHHEIEQTLAQNEVWFSSVGTQDDIFEGRPIITVQEHAREEDLHALARAQMPDASLEEREQAVRDILQRLEGPAGPGLRNDLANAIRELYSSSSILCFFRSIDIQRFWYQYASGGTGYSIVFDMHVPWSFEAIEGMPPSEMVPLEVQYRDGERPLVQIPLGRIEPTLAYNQIEAALLTKSSDWRDQNELRFVRVGIGEGLVQFPRESLLALVIGYATGDDDRRTIMETVSRHHPDLPVFVASEAANSYRLAIRPA